MMKLAAGCLLLLLTSSCKAREVPKPPPPPVKASASAQPMAPIPVPLDTPESVTQQLVAEAERDRQPPQPTEEINVHTPPKDWTIGLDLGSAFSRMHYSWEVGPNNVGSMYSARGLGSPRQTTLRVPFRASDAALRALKAKLVKDDCCSAFRSSACHVYDAPPASINFSMGDLSCAAYATPECEDELPAQRCFKHLARFLRATCGPRCG